MSKWLRGRPDSTVPGSTWRRTSDRLSLVSCTPAELTSVSPVNTIVVPPSCSVKPKRRARRAARATSSLRSRAAKIAGSRLASLSDGDTYTIALCSRTGPYSST